VVFGISLLAFAILHVLGDPCCCSCAERRQGGVRALPALLGLDRPLYVQYWKFVSRAVLGDFGKSWYADTPAFRLVIGACAHDLSHLAGCSCLADRAALGTIARSPPHVGDSLCTVVAVAGQAAPIFWLGIMLIIVFSVRLRLLPRPGTALAELPDARVLPRRGAGAHTMRLVAPGVIEVMKWSSQDGRAKGWPRDGWS